MFQLTKDGAKSLKSQNSEARRGRKREMPPFAFTEHGIAILPGVMKSMRVFVLEIGLNEIAIKRIPERESGLVETA
jgi:hypothetical protein